MHLIFLYALIKKTDILSAFTDGVKEGMQTVVRIFPILVSINGCQYVSSLWSMDLLAQFLAPATQMIGVPSELLPMALLRPFSGSGSLALLDNMLKTYGVDTYIGRTAAVIAASTETTLYTISIYLGGKAKKYGKLLIAAFAADFVSVIMACFISRLLY